MMKAMQLIDYARDCAIELCVVDGELFADGTTEVLTPEVIAAIRAEKATLKEMLTAVRVVHGRWHLPVGVNPQSWGTCFCCEWHSPLSDAPEPICLLCASANARQEGAPTCECWCSTALEVVGRADPGGPLMCNQCADQQRARRALRQKVAVNA